MANLSTPDLTGRELIETYRGFEIRFKATVKTDPYSTVINNRLWRGAPLEKIRRFIDRYLEQNRILD